MKVIESTSYPVFFDEDFKQLKAFLSNHSYSKVFVLVDSNTEQHCLPLIQPALADLKGFDIIEIDPGEENKNIDFCIGIWRMLLDFEADRNCLLINLGGGVITDIGGFAASTYKRGIDFINIPTTLLSQVDASVGGKTGIDMDNLKNVIGTFAQPKAVFIEPRFLKTLDQRQLNSGFAEIIKHGLIYDRDFFNKVKTLSAESISPEIIYRSVEIKNEVVSTDPLEKGLRKILNFGHTIGHAIESWSLSKGSSPLLHGEAIAIGFICEAYLSVKYSGLGSQELEEIQATVLRFFPQYFLKTSAFKEVLNLMRNDKKNSPGQVNFSLLKNIGESSIDNFCSDEDICDSLNYYISLNAST